MSEPKKAALVMDTRASNMRALSGHYGDAEIHDAVTAQPFLTRSCGQAWRVDFEPMLARKGARRGDDATVGIWLIEAPWAHPLWHSYIIGLVHLRPTIRGKPAVILMDQATHQFWLWAADPDAAREPFIRGQLDNLLKATLDPANFAAQLRCPDDDAARRVIEHTIEEICDGRLSPDVEFQSEWRRRFGDSGIKDEFK